MNLQFLKNTQPFKQLFALLLITLGIGILVSLIGVLISAIFIDGNIFERVQYMGELRQPGDLNLMKYFQFISQLGFFIFPALLFGLLVEKNILNYFRLAFFPKAPILALGLLIIIVGNPFIEWLVYQNSLISLPESLSSLEQWMRDAEEKAAHMTNLFLQMDSWSDYLVNILMIGVLAAVGEELLMRGVLQPIFIKITKNAHAGIWIAAFVFSFIHFQFYGFFARLFLGAVLGYMFYYSSNLWVPIIGHFFNNAAAVTYVYATNTPLDSVNLSQMEKNEYGFLYAILSLSLVVLGMFYLRYYSIKNKKA